MKSASRGSATYESISRYQFSARLRGFRAAEHAAATTSRGVVVRGAIEAFVSACSLKDAYYILTKQAGEARGREVVRDCLKSYSVESLDQEACFASAYSDEPDFEDGCIRAMAERAGVDFIITRDRAAFVRSTIKTFSPAEFIRAFPIPESKTAISRLSPVW